jgi:hypothetical protein
MPASEPPAQDSASPQAPRAPKLNALERAQRDLAAGRPDLARDRLTGCLYTLHRRGEYRQDVYILLGRVLFEMRDYARAGAAWLLTEHHGADVATATAAFHKRFGNDAGAILSLVKPHAPSEDYPPAVQERLKAWGYRYRPYRPRSNPHAMHEHVEGEEKGVRPIEMGCIIAALVVGLTIAYMVWLSFRPR